MEQPKVVRDNRWLFQNFHLLRENDIILGRIRLRPSEETLLTDLLQRGVRMIPSATSQLVSRSKALQTRLFHHFMPEKTIAVYDQHDLLRATTLYCSSTESPVVMKRDRKNSGIGIHKFDNIEQLYNHVTFANLPYPFVIQPFMQGSRDIRVIILEEYVEAYERKNSKNFRRNLHCGAKATPYTLSAEQLTFCHDVMVRGAFPWAHLDLMLMPDGTFYLQEINLRGGLRGARIDGKQYQKKTAVILERLLSELLLG